MFNLHVLKLSCNFINKMLNVTRKFSAIHYVYLIALSRALFTREKIASECDVALERYCTYVSIKIISYCAICSIAQKPPNHKCFKNWTGSSTPMADIIATGF